MNKTVIKICSVIMALSLVSLVFASCKSNKTDYTPIDSQNTEAPTGDINVNNNTPDPVPANVNPLTGLALADSEAGKRPVAIMVENSPQARPQWGLSTPDIVVEGVVEGGVTRMMWIYADATKIPDKVGPVRSARHDYVEIADGMNAIYTHSGGSDLAYNYIKSIGMKDIDGLYTEGTYFFRDTTRNTAIEHRLYTNGSYIQKAISEKKLEAKAKDESWMPYRVELGASPRIPFGYPEQNGGCQSVTVEFSPSFKHTFKYNPNEKLYYNYMNSSEMKDGNNNKTMAVTNVIVMYCATKSVDSTGHQDWDMTSGSGLYITNGCGEQITWKKASKTAPLKFYGTDGKELIVNKGQTWIGVVPEANRSKTSIAV